MMARLALLIDRVDFLLNDFGPFVGGPAVVFGGLILLTAFMLYLSLRPKRTQSENQPES